MTSAAFQQAVSGFRQIPKEDREKFLAMAGALSEHDREVICRHLSKHEADLEKCDATYRNQVRRGRAMLKQVEDTDVPLLRKMLHA